MEKSNTIYTKSVITKKIVIEFKNIGKNIQNILLEKLKECFEGKCISYGYIKRSSINIMNYSSGKIDGSNVIYEVLFSADICSPIKGLELMGRVKSITKAGIRAVAITKDTDNPIIIFIARDFKYQEQQFQEIEINDKIKILVIGSKFDLNDTNIYIIADLIKVFKKT